MFCLDNLFCNIIRFRSSCSFSFFFNIIVFSYFWDSFSKYYSIYFFRFYLFWYLYNLNYFLPFSCYKFSFFILFVICICSLYLLLDYGSQYIRNWSILQPIYKKSNELIGWPARFQKWPAPDFWKSYKYLILLYFYVTSDQPDFFCFAKKMARLAAPHMKSRQEGPMPKPKQSSELSSV